MKRLIYSAFVIGVFVMFGSSVIAKNAMNIDEFTKEISKAVPKEFKFDEKGTDKGNLYVVYKKSPQEVMTVNWQKEYDIEFPDQETTTVKGHKTIFYYMGFKKSAGIVVFLKNNAGYLVVGFNKPYMGEEIVKKEELIDIVKKLDLSRFE